MRPFEHLIPLEQARSLLLGAVRPVEDVETVPLAEACGRVLARDVTSPVDVPPFERAAMDGYALRAGDVAHASPAAPVSLRLAGALFAGATLELDVTAGTCVEIATGAPLPYGRRCRGHGGGGPQERVDGGDCLWGEDRAAHHRPSRCRRGAGGGGRGGRHGADSSAGGCAGPQWGRRARSCFGGHGSPWVRPGTSWWSRERRWGRATSTT